MRLLGGKANRSGLVSVTALLVAGVMMIGGAVGVGLRWPSAWWRAGPQDSTTFDYSALGSRLRPLSDGYVRSVLGRSSNASPAGATAAGDDAAEASRSPRRGSAPVEVAHAFTNDDIDLAYEVDALPFRAVTDMTGASRQTSDPSDCSPVGGTAWYRYRSPDDTALFADTFGSRRPTALAIYTGDQPRSLHSLGCDVNALGNAQVGFRPTAGATYWFQVTAAAGEGRTVFELATVGPTSVETITPTGGRPDGTVNPATNNRADISGDGRWVVFISNARNLAPAHPRCEPFQFCSSLYLRDRATGTTTIVGHAVSQGPDAGGGIFQHPASSPDGRFVGFTHVDVPGTPGFHGPADARSAAHAYVFDRVTGTYEIVSRNSAGEVARSEPGRNAATAPGLALAAGFPNGASAAPSISSDGRYVTFWSDGANLGGHVEYGRAVNVYRRDRLTGTTRVVSVDAEGRPMRANSFACTGRNISGDGRYVFFASTFGTGQDDHRISHLFLWDATTGRTRQVTNVPDGVQTLGSFCPSISLDGSRVAFVSRDALLPDDTNGTPDVYAYEVATRRLQRVSVTSAGEQTIDANYDGTEGSGVLPRSVSLSADGRYVAFDSSAPELVPSWVGSTRRVGPGVPGPIQVYVHDIVTGATVLASVSAIGEPLAGNSVIPYMSADGSSVSFLNSGLWTDRNTVNQLDVMVHELR